MVELVPSYCSEYVITDSGVTNTTTSCSLPRLCAVQNIFCALANLILKNLCNTLFHGRLGYFRALQCSSMRQEFWLSTLEISLMILINYLRKEKEKKMVQKKYSEKKRFY